jgi:hypothetical protein
MTHALRQKDQYRAGPIFFAGQRYRKFMCISCGQLWSERMENAVGTLKNWRHSKVQADYAWCCRGRGTDLSSSSLFTSASENP